jgi:hypothetical protein
MECSTFKGYQRSRTGISQAASLLSGFVELLQCSIELTAPVPGHGFGRLCLLMHARCIVLGVLRIGYGTLQLALEFILLEQGSIELALKLLPVPMHTGCHTLVELRADRLTPAWLRSRGEG